jgi:hypothetical protein
MNTRRPIEGISDDPAVLSVAFNNDASHFSVGLNTGFCSTYPPYYSPGLRRGLSARRAGTVHPFTTTRASRMAVTFLPGHPGW